PCDFGHDRVSVLASPLEPVVFRSHTLRSCRPVNSCTYPFAGPHSTSNVGITHSGGSVSITREPSIQSRSDLSPRCPTAPSLPPHTPHRNSHDRNDAHNYGWPDPGQLRLGGCCTQRLDSIRYTGRLRRWRLASRTILRLGVHRRVGG